MGLPTHMTIQQVLLCAVAVLAVPQSGLVSTRLDKRLTNSTATVPKFVLDYAPLVHLYSTDTYLPSDISNQLRHTVPEINFKPVQGVRKPLTLDNLSQLNALGGPKVYLTSKGDFTQDPPWLNGVLPNAQGKTVGATSSTIIVHDKGGGVVDAFYFYFYAYNQGNKITVVEQEAFLGDHVGDWEHNMIRFTNKKPTAIWYSQHATGTAYTYSAVQKSPKHPKRPLAYSGNGTHASWATAGTHAHELLDVTLPAGFLEDFTDAGPIWDPLLSAYYYAVDFPNDTNGVSTKPTFRALANPTEPGKKQPVNWLCYMGQWGDDQLPESDPRQRGFFFNATFEYTAGPNGPRFKGLNRIGICPENFVNGGPPGECVVRPALTPGS